MISLSPMTIARYVIAFVAVFAFLLEGLPKSIEAGKERAHNPQNVVVQLKECKGEDTGSDYVLTLDYEIENKTGATISSIGVETTFKAKDGSTLGSVSSFFGGNGLQLEKGKTTKESTYWYYSDLGRGVEELYRILYEEGLDSVTFSTEIQSVGWSDGYI